MSKQDPSRCCELVQFGGRMVTFNQCLKPWKVEVEGRKYCGIHDPKAKQKRREASDAHYRETAYREMRRAVLGHMSKEDAEWIKTGFDIKPSAIPETDVKVVRMSGRCHTALKALVARIVGLES